MTTIFKVSNDNLKYMHLLAQLSVVALIPFVSFELWYLAVSFFCYLFYFTITQSVMLHRFYGHAMFSFKFKLIEQIFKLITLISLRGSPIAWAYIHRLHHKHTDTAEDPHSPHFMTYKQLGSGDHLGLSSNMNTMMVRKLLTPENIRMSEYYWLYALSVPAAMLVIDINVFYYAWLIPVCIFKVMTQAFNYMNHYEMPGSYVNYSTGPVGKSRNNLILWFFSLGEAWHNNHHALPGEMNFKHQWWELDPSYWIINLVKK